MASLRRRGSVAKAAKVKKRFSVLEGDHITLLNGTLVLSFLCSSSAEPFHEIHGMQFSVLRIHPVQEYGVMLGVPTRC